jgi:hypothetical protein
MISHNPGQLNSRQTLGADSSVDRRFSLAYQSSMCSA